MLNQDRTEKSACPMTRLCHVWCASSLYWIWLSLLVFALDRVTKSFVQAHVALYETIPVTSFFNLTLAYNKGAAFSFLNSASGWQGWLFGGIAVTVSVMILGWMARLPKQNRWGGVALALILGGALGNLTDRLLWGQVVDFIQLYAGSWYWPSFNIADSAICIGAVMLLIEALRKRAD